MTELWLRFKDENGEERKVLVESQEFTVGRHSGNDLAIANGKLSREHVKISRFADIFIVSECGSSNGTTINENTLEDPVALKNGDKLNLGGGVEVEIELISDDPQADAPGTAPSAAPSAGTADGPGMSSAEATVSASAGSVSAVSENGGSGIPTSIFYIAPVLGVLILVLLGGIVYLASSGEQPKPTNDDLVYRDDRPTKDNDDPSGRTPKSNKTSDLPPLNNTSITTDPTPSPPPVNLSDSAKCEQNGAAFLRNIAQNDPKAFLTGEQAQIINSKIKQMSASTSIADNINSAKRSSSQIKTLAASKNLKPQLLTAAALAKLGTSRGDALQAAKAMADVLEKLGTQIGSELANDSLLMIAAYDQGTAGDFMKLRNMLQQLATESSESSREIRTIWFLHKNGKITDAEYNFAIQFLAIGTIGQNPKDFGVNAEGF